MFVGSIGDQGEIKGATGALHSQSRRVRDKMKILQLKRRFKLFKDFPPGGSSVDAAVSRCVGSWSKQGLMAQCLVPIQSFDFLLMDPLFAACQA